MVCEQHCYDLKNKVVSIWFFKEKACAFAQAHELLTILNYLISAGAKVNIFLDNDIADTFPQNLSIKCFDNKFDCLFLSETLIIYGNFLNFGTPNELKIAKKMNTGSIIDLGCNFQLKSFMSHKVAYISF